MNISRAKCFCHPKSFILAACLAIPFAQIQAQTSEVVYKDNFARTGPLISSTPPTANVSGGGQWMDNTGDSGAEGLATNGSALVIDKLDLVALPTEFKELPAQSKVTLSADLQNSGGWIGFGFSTGRNIMTETDGAVVWVQLWANGELKLIKGRSASEQDATTSVGIVTDPGHVVHIDITLDTSTNKAEISADGSPVGHFDFQIFSGVNLVFFHGVDGSNGTAENLSLTIAPLTASSSPAGSKKTN